MLDEAHERTIHTDVMFGLLKKVIKKRKDLKERNHYRNQHSSLEYNKGGVLSWNFNEYK